MPAAKRIAALFGIWIVLPVGAQRIAQEVESRAIRRLIEQRENAWNSGNVAGYGQLLTDDADLLSATGRSAQGRQAILALYVEQRAGAYNGWTTSTPIEAIRFLRPDVAIVNTRFVLTGLRAADGTTPSARRGLLMFVVSKEDGHWLIAAMRGIPETPIR